MTSLPALIRSRLSWASDPGRALLIVFFLSVTLYYWWLISYGDLGNFFRPEDEYSTLYVHMWDRLIQGRFDIDPGVVKGEGFERNGRVYSAFGYFPVFLRAIASPFLDLHTRDISRVSCLVAACLALFLSIRLGFRLKLDEGVPRPFFMILVGMIALTGPCVFVLGPTLVHIEPTIWGYAVVMYFADGYIALFQHAERLRLARLLKLTIASGVAFLIRAPFGFVTAIPLLWIGVTNAIAWLPTSQSVRRWLPKPAPMALERGWILVSVLASLPIFFFVGYVNYERWGNPFVFMVQTLNVGNRTNPWEVEMIRKYGDMSLSQVPCGFEHYFVPHSDNLSPRAPFVVASNVNRSCERLPYKGYIEPASQIPLTITIPGLLFAAGLGVVALAKRGFEPWGVRKSGVVVLCAGLAFPCAVVLAFIARCIRYQIYFLPPLILLSMIAVGYLKDVRALRRPIARVIWLSVFACLLVYASAIAHLVNIDQKLWGPGAGPGQREVAASYVRDYLSWIEDIVRQ